MVRYGDTSGTLRPEGGDGGCGGYGSCEPLLSKMSVWAWVTSLTHFLPACVCEIGEEGRDCPVEE